jgi:hypothetical protein
VELVLVEWLDSRRGEGWVRLDDLRDDLKATRCRSVGWIIGKDATSVTLAGHLGDNPEQCCGDMTIPANSILRISPLTLSRKRQSVTAVSKGLARNAKSQ